LAVSKQKTTLYKSIRQVLEQARGMAYRAVNCTMVQAYWRVGKLIVEDEQQGKRKAEYGEALLKELSQKLTRDFGKGFTDNNLRYMRQFYLSFPIRHALRDKSLENNSTSIRHALRDKSQTTALPAIRDAARHKSSQEPMLRPELSWTHYRLLLSVKDTEARNYYLHEAAEQNWSTRALERQINSLYYKRLISSANKKPVKKEAEKKTKELAQSITDFIKDPFVLEFLDLRNSSAHLEKDIEQGIINNLQSFLLELGKGFSFVGRQYRISAEEEHFYIDLVFYNYLLKCFVLIDLKLGKLTHQDIGQMDMYVRIFEDCIKPKGDNFTIGIILCSEKNETIARYSVMKENKRLFASKYMLYLPTEKELARELRREILSLKTKNKK